jgi:hypothetical protein
MEALCRMLDHEHTVRIAESERDATPQSSPRR